MSLMKKLNLILSSFIIIFLFIFSSAKADTFLSGFPLIIDADTIKIGNDKIRLLELMLQKKNNFAKNHISIYSFFLLKKNILVEKFLLTA